MGIYGICPGIVEFWFIHIASDFPESVSTLTHPIKMNIGSHFILGIYTYLCQKIIHSIVPNNDYVELLVDMDMIGQV